LSDRDHAVVRERVEAFLAAAGTRTRYFVAPGERSFDLSLDAAKRALAHAALRGGDLDFVIYAGIGRGWLEPSTASVFQQALGAERATCFDVLDGCAGWIRSLQVADGLFATGAFRCGMILNSECGVEGFAQYRVESLEDLDKYLANYTIGEAAAATIVTNEMPGNFYMRFANYGEHADLCMIPFHNADQFLPRPAGLPAGHFFARSYELLSITTRKIIEAYESDPVFREGRYDIAFGHAASEKASQLIRARIGVPEETYFSTHADYGNTISASVPLAMSLAREQERLRRGDRVLAIVGASGITVGLATFVY
jgi:3-oxoacyl-[acyl-carrier-protein] synthase III